MSDLSTLSQPHVGRTHRQSHDTEVAAAHAIASVSGRLVQDVVRLLRDHPDGLTDDEGGALLGGDRLRFGRRRNELAKAGLVRDSGLRRPTPVGRRAIVWQLAPPAQDPPSANSAPLSTDRLPERNTVTAPGILFHRTGGSDFPDLLKCMISGPPKSGKTTLLGTVPNIVIADTEPHANNLQSIAHKNVPYVPVNGTMDLQRLLVVLRDNAMRAKAAEDLGLPKIEAVAIDTLDTLQKIMKRERMREQRTNKFLRDDWGWLKEEMTGILSAFTALPMHVFFTVHLKTKDIGTEDSPQTIILPGLEGAIAEEVAGMVGYSLLAFRKQEIRQDGSPYTKYWLRAEGDETYNFLGNRAAGRLPDVIEPDFTSILAAATAGRAAVHEVPQPVAPVEIRQTSADQAAPAAPAPEQPAPVAQPAPEPQPAPAQATPAGEPATQAPSADEPINANALTFCKRVYDAAGLEFPEDLIRGLTLGQARELVVRWQGIQQSTVEGTAEQSPADEMAAFLLSRQWLSAGDLARLQGGDRPAEAAPAKAEKEPIVADVNGTIDQVMEYIGEDLSRAQEAYNLEIAKPKPRATLINVLTNLGVQVQTPVQNEAPAPAPAPAAAAEAPAQPAEVTPAAPGAETPSTEGEVQAAQTLLAEQLGAVPINEDGTALPCEECGGVVDDEDIAVLSKSRFSRRLCVADYIAETKKPRLALA